MAFLKASKSSNFRLEIMEKILDPLKQHKQLPYMCYEEYLSL